VQGGSLPLKDDPGTRGDGKWTMDAEFTVGKAPTAYRLRATVMKNDHELAEWIPLKYKENDR
jgi:hypothetical protein